VLKVAPNEINAATLSDEVYCLALERIEALSGCIEDSPEERELIDWAVIADAREQSAGIVTSGDTLGLEWLEDHAGSLAAGPFAPALPDERLTP
jgi:hypothetical protein